MFYVCVYSGAQNREGWSKFEEHVVLLRSRVLTTFYLQEGLVIFNVRDLVFHV